MNPADETPTTRAEAPLGTEREKVPEPTKERKGFTGWVRSIAGFILAQYIVIGMGLGALFGYLWPHVAARGGVIRSEYTIIYGCISIIFLISGLQLSPSKLKEHTLNMRLHVVVQGISFVIFPVVLLAFVHICLAAGAIRDDAIDTSIFVGMIVTACIPTTIASNVVMTRLAGGDDAAAIIEVVIGNVTGAFLSPFLIYGFLPRTHDFDDWHPASPSTFGAMYGSVMMQLGLSVLLPLAVGQAARWLFEPQVRWLLETLYVAKWSAVSLVLVVWSTFSGAFQTGALQDTPGPSIVFNVLMNLVIYLFFTVLCFYAARPPARLCARVNNLLADSPFARRRLPNLLRRALRLRRMSKEETIAVCFCGAAKTTGLGIPLVPAMWRDADNRTIALIQVPVLLYTVEQVFAAQGVVHFFRWYLRRGAEGDAEAGTGTAEARCEAASREAPGVGTGVDDPREDKGCVATRRDDEDDTTLALEEEGWRVKSESGTTEDHVAGTHGNRIG